MNLITDIGFIIYFFTVRFMHDFVEYYVEPRMNYSIIEQSGIDNES
jgi:hypothetical protein